ncbi:MAG TPA: carboxylating nicotinate-nucleotide diphosphorylase [Rectinemataceae bacterium]|nr:carboxylating nicotinate-nucleotide diphosphorylase [Rectinemataceae bacterium]
MKKKNYHGLIERALAEDLGTRGDVTSAALFPKKERAVFVLLAKDEGILCGLGPFSHVFETLDRKAEVETYFKDGDRLKRGEVVARVRAKLRAVLAGERTALNLVSHLSGVATKTSLFVAAAQGKPAILDTRKTIPGLRRLQKYAVACGGGRNHRMGLHDMILIKDNHVDAAGSIARAVERARAKWGKRFPVEVETRNLREVEEALAAGVDRIMLDNMDDATMRRAVVLVGGRVETEASGNISLERLPALGAVGVDLVSVGELTHTVKAFDFSLKRENEA